MMLDIAETLDPLLDARARRVEEAELGLGEEDDIDEYTAETTLQLIFFDGEEAFMDWTATDSIYGARSVVLALPSYFLHSCVLFSYRHLANMWASTYLPPHPKRRLISAASPTTPLSTIEHLILLDLIGAPHPRVRSYFPDTAWLFDMLVSAETRLRAAGILDADALGRSFFSTRTGGDVSLGYMGDDHLPFLHRGVSVLHVITEPFPHVWHTLGVSTRIHEICMPSSLFPCSPADLIIWLVVGFVYRTMRRRSIFRRRVRGTSFFVCSSQSIWGCALNRRPSAENHHPQLITLRR